MEQNDNEKETFFQKYRTDNKYKAKVQLIGYGIFILLILVGINVTSLNSASHGNITSLRNSINDLDSDTTTDKNKSSLLTKLNNNYEFETKASITLKKEEQTETKEVLYTGKSSKNNMEITKQIADATSNFYKVESRYYTKNDDTYQLAKEEDIYDIVEKEYIEWDSIKEYIDKASLDHVIEYSSGPKEYVYHLGIKEIIKSYQGIEEAEISIKEENDILTINIDYTNLIKEINKEVSDFKLTAIYKNIGKVEDFTIIEDTSEVNQGENNE